MYAKEARAISRANKEDYSEDLSYILSQVKKKSYEGQLELNLYGNNFWLLPEVSKGQHLILDLQDFGYYCEAFDTRDEDRFTGSCGLKISWGGGGGCKMKIYTVSEQQEYDGSRWSVLIADNENLIGNIKSEIKYKYLERIEYNDKMISWCVTEDATSEYYEEDNELCNKIIKGLSSCHTIEEFKTAINFSENDWYLFINPTEVIE